MYRLQKISRSKNDKKGLSLSSRVILERVWFRFRVVDRQIPASVYAPVQFTVALIRLGASCPGQSVNFSRLPSRKGVERERFKEELTQSARIIRKACTRGRFKLDFPEFTPGRGGCSGFWNCSNASGTRANSVSRLFRRSTLEEELDVGIVVGDNGAGRGHTAHSSRDYQEAQLQPSPQ